MKAALTEFMRLYEDGKLGTDSEVIEAYNEAVRALPAPASADSPQEGHGEPCYWCKEPCDGLAADPGRWPIALCHRDDPGVVKWHHERCVSERLIENQPAPSSARSQESDVDAFLQHAEALGLMSDQALADEVKRGGSVVVEKYIAGLKWSEHATEDEKALVAGNLRTFWTWLHINSRGRIKSALSASRRQEATEGMAAAARGVLQMLRGRPGATMADCYEHCRNRGDDVRKWPQWALDYTGYVTEEAGAMLIYELMARSEGAAK